MHDLSKLASIENLEIVIELVSLLVSSLFVRNTIGIHAHAQCRAFTPTQPRHSLRMAIGMNATRLTYLVSWCACVRVFAWMFHVRFSHINIPIYRVLEESCVFFKHMLVIRFLVEWFFSEKFRNARIKLSTRSWSCVSRLRLIFGKKKGSIENGLVRILGYKIWHVILIS